MTMQPEAITLSQLTTDFIDDLEPREQRYDLPLEDDFVFSVLPNGTKTWAFIYTYDDRQRRKTLGVYPEMNSQQAFGALQAARTMVRKLDEPLEEDIGDAAATGSDRRSRSHRRRRDRIHPWSQGARKRNHWGKWLVPIAVGLASAVLVLLWPRSAPQPPAEPATEPMVREMLAPLPETPPVIAPPAEVAPDSADPLPANSEDPDIPAATESPTEATSDAPARPAERENKSALQLAAEMAPDAPAPSPVAVESATPDNDAASAVAEAQLPAAADKPAAAAATDLDPGLQAGRVERAVVSSAISGREPADDLGTTIEIPAAGFERLYFFTELRGFDPQTITHRWLRANQEVTRVPLRVAGGWRWRTYSSKDFVASDAGSYAIEVVAANGAVVARHEFELVVAE